MSNEGKIDVPAVPQGAPEINYPALIEAAFAKNRKWTQGTTGCIAFARGAEWFREQSIAATPAPAPAQEVASAFTKALDIRLAQGWNLTGNAIPVLYTDTINDYQVRRDDVWLCTTDALKTEKEVGLTASQFDLICQAIDKADTATMEGDYMLDSDDCINVVRVMQALFDVTKPAQEVGLTDEEIEAIAQKHMSTVGDHWCNEEAIRERHAEDFARAIIAALRAKGQT